MNHSMDDGRILAEMERRLARDDPGLTTLIDTLNHQFPDDQEDTDSRGTDSRGTDSRGTDSHHDGIGRVDWRWKAAMAVAVIAVLGMILTAVFTRSPSPDGNQGPAKSLTPAVSVFTQRRGTQRRPRPVPALPGRRRPASERPEGRKPHACT
ncbi:hypothetical protein ACIBAG_28050 [Streptomyces sp. NPDC051243]|uniref:hypothetical protein n=1 Tax=Streptomyces sp. NPDC051243 TaxID=3365646 RepID=UPI0037B9D686